MQVYEFTQTENEIEVSVVPTTTKPNVETKLAGEVFTLVVDDVTIIKGKLFAQAENVLWQRDPKSGVITVSLDKVDGKQTGDWPVLIKGGADGQLNGDLDMQSRFMLGMWLESVDKHDLAFPLLEKSADEGFVPALLKVAAVYMVGKESVPNLAVNKDMDKALYYHTLAAEGGDPEAQYILGGMYAQGYDTPTGKLDADSEKAMDFFDAAIASPHLRMSDPSIFIAAAFEGGLLALQNGDAGRAAKFWSRSSALGHPQSCYNFAILLLNGHGCPRNIAGALRLFRAAQSMDPKLAPPEAITSLSSEELAKLIELDEQGRKDVEQGKLEMATLDQLIAKAKRQVGGQPEGRTVSNDSPVQSTPKLTTSSRKRKSKKKEAAERGQQNLQTIGMIAGGIALAALVYNRFSQ